MDLVEAGEVMEEEVAMAVGSLDREVDEEDLGQGGIMALWVSQMENGDEERGYLKAQPALAGVEGAEDRIEADLAAKMKKGEIQTRTHALISSSSILGSTSELCQTYARPSRHRFWTIYLLK